MKLQKSKAPMGGTKAWSSGPGFLLAGLDGRSVRHPADRRQGRRDAALQRSAGFGHGDAAVLLAPYIVRQMAGRGYAKDDVKQFLHRGREN